MEITMLSAMAANDFVTSLDTQRARGIRLLDLKNGIFGKDLASLTDAEAASAKQHSDERGMAVHCMSSVVFDGDIEAGESAFRVRFMPMLARITGIAGILKPHLVRLIAATSGRRAEFSDSAAYLRVKHPWLIPLYREAITAVNRAGFRVTIENECHHCIFATPLEVRAFYDALGMDNVSFTYDVQNLWQMGTAPSVEVYRTLAPLVDYLHLKGGIADEAGNLAYASTLADASWPVVSIVREAAASGCPVICLNPSHGRKKEGYDYANITARDLDFVRALIGTGGTQ